MFEKTFVMHFIFSKLKKRKKSECNVLQVTNAQKRWISIFCKFKELKKYDLILFASLLKKAQKHGFNFCELKELKKRGFNCLQAKKHKKQRFFFRSISRSTGTGDFEFFTSFPCTGDFEFLRFFLLCTGDFEFLRLFSVLETLRFSRFPCARDFAFLRSFVLCWRLKSFYDFFPCTGDFEFFTLFLGTRDFEFLRLFFSVLESGDFEFLRFHHVLYWRL